MSEFVWFELLRLLELELVGRFGILPSLEWKSGQPDT